MTAIRKRQYVETMALRYSEMDRDEREKFRHITGMDAVSLQPGFRAPANLDLINELGNRELSSGEKQALGALCVKFGAGVQNWLMHWAKKLMGKSVFTESEWEAKVKELLAPGYGAAPSSAVWVRADHFDDMAKAKDDAQQRARNYENNCQALHTENAGLKRERDALAEKYKLALEKLANPAMLVPASVRSSDPLYGPSPFLPLVPVLKGQPIPVDPALVKNCRFLRVVVNGGEAKVEGYNEPVPQPLHALGQEPGPSASLAAVESEKLRHEAERAEKNRLDWLPEDLLAEDAK